MNTAAVVLVHRASSSIGATMAATPAMVSIEMKNTVPATRCSRAPLGANIATPPEIIPIVPPLM